jgi:amino acid transporter
MSYAFARDGGLPWSSYLYKLDSKKIPIRALWVVCVIDLLILLPSLYSERLYEAINSIGTVGTYISYSIPIFLRLFKRDFEPGPFTLGKFSRPIGIISCIWLIGSSIALMLPIVHIRKEDYLDYQSYVYDTLAHFNWSPAMVFVISFLALLAWIVNVRKWFTGPKRDMDLDNLEDEDMDEWMYESKKF